MPGTPRAFSKSANALRGVFLITHQEVDRRGLVPPTFASVCQRTPPTELLSEVEITYGSWTPPALVRAKRNESASG